MRVIAGSQSTKVLLLLLHPFNGLFFRTTWISRYQKGKSSLDLNESGDNGFWGDGSGVSWTVCKQSAPGCRQITMPTPYHSVLQSDALHDVQPIVSKQKIGLLKHNFGNFQLLSSTLMVPISLQV